MPLLIPHDSVLRQQKGTEPQHRHELLLLAGLGLILGWSVCAGYTCTQLLLVVLLRLWLSVFGAVVEVVPGKPILELFQSRGYAQLITAATTEKNTLLDLIFISRPQQCLQSAWPYHLARLDRGSPTPLQLSMAANQAYI
ncbi:hypothetical protein N1851_014024 [Merluccius polli]|uniref:Uncharacterized protein n=1 Tax=Merluccius polli TaxID=89951 RepID=A0AA47MV52_MERPO|nr:hypothetical protein N1851_014024 [Merluccius polli]